MIKGAPTKNGGYPRNAVSDDLNRKAGKKEKVSCSMCVHYGDDQSCSYKNKVVSELGYDHWKHCSGFDLRPKYINDENINRIRKQPNHKNYGINTAAQKSESERIKEIEHEIRKKKVELASLPRLLQLPNINGIKVKSKKYGEGVVNTISGDHVIVKFSTVEKKFNCLDAFANGFLVTDEVDIVEAAKHNKTITDRRKRIEEEIRRLQSEYARLKK